MVSIAKIIKTATIRHINSACTDTIQQLFQDIQGILHSRSSPCFIGHVRAHSNLSGPLAAGNQAADLHTQICVLQALDNIEQAKRSHSIHHQSARALRWQFKIP